MSFYYHETTTAYDEEESWVSLPKCRGGISSGPHGKRRYKDPTRYLPKNLWNMESKWCLYYEGGYWKVFNTTKMASKNKFWYFWSDFVKWVGLRTFQYILEPRDETGGIKISMKDWVCTIMAVLTPQEYWERSWWVLIPSNNSRKVSNKKGIIFICLFYFVNFEPSVRRRLLEAAF